MCKMQTWIMSQEISGVTTLPDRSWLIPEEVPFNPLILLTCETCAFVAPFSALTMRVLLLDSERRVILTDAPPPRPEREETEGSENG